MNQLLLLTALAGFLMSCNSASDPSDIKARDFIIAEKDLVPEGLAFDSRTHTAYVGSMYKRKIVMMDQEGETRDFIGEAQDGIWSLLGMEVDENRGQLWAVSSQAHELAPLKHPDSLQWRSALHCYDLSSGKLIKKLLCADTAIFLNDLTIAANGDVYITESNKNRLYRLRAGGDQIERFFTPDSVWFMNGLCLSADEQYLFLGCWNGLIRLRLSDKSYQWVKSPGLIPVGGIDGLSWHRNTLIAHQTDKVVRLHLNEDLSVVIRSDTLSSGKEFDHATTGETAGDWYYFIVNSQVQSAYDFQKKDIKPLDSLEPVIIRRIPLKP